MKEQTNQSPAVKNEHDDDRQWASWWQGYWSDVPATRRKAEPTRQRFPWRESAHEFDFGGEE